MDKHIVYFRKWFDHKLLVRDAFGTEFYVIIRISTPDQKFDCSIVNSKTFRLITQTRAALTNSRYAHRKNLMNHVANALKNEGYIILFWVEIEFDDLCKLEQKDIQY